MTDSRRPRTLVTVATYNERENLPSLVDAIFAHAPSVDLLVVDDNSPDGTGQWVDQMSVREPRLHCLHRSGKLGLGTAIVAGMRWAIEHGFDYVLNMDADFSHPPRCLPELIAAMDRPGPMPVDCAIGSRYVAGGGIEGWPLRRRLMSKSVNFYARWMLGLSVRDCSGAFRCYRTNALAQLDFNQLRSTGYSFQEEILWRMKRAGCRFVESPIVFVDRVKGQSKIDSGEALEALRVIFSLGVANILRRP